MGKEFPTDIFANIALLTVPRVLGFCDRQPKSPTLGCCDRAYWHYRLLDISNARYQEAAHLMALCHEADIPGNRYFKNPAISRWAREAWRFWLSKRNSDGSCTEVYPNERSFCATSFSAAAFVETVMLLGGAASWEEELKESRNTMLWLSESQNPAVSNQMAASLLALTGYAGIIEDKRFKEIADKRKREVLALMGPDGAFTEYGGLDVGYQSITLSVLARVCAISGDKELAGALAKSAEVIEPLVDEHGWVDSTKNSRNTQYIYPFGLMALGSPIAQRVRKGLEENTILNPLWMDDRYCIAFASDYLMASQEAAHAHEHL